MRASCKLGLTLRKQQVILTPAAWTHAQSGENGSSTTGRCSGRLTLTSGVSSVRQPEDVGRSCASPSSVTQWVLWSRPGRVTHDGDSSSPPGGCSRRSRPPNAALHCVSFSSAAAHVALPTSKSASTGQGKVRLRHSARSTCSKRSTSGPQSSPGRTAGHSSASLYSQPRLVMWPPKCKDPVALPLGLLCCLEVRAALPVGPVPVARSFTDLQEVRKQLLTAKAELVQLQAPHSLPELQFKIFTSTHWVIHGPGIGKSISP